MDGGERGRKEVIKDFFFFFIMGNLCEDCTFYEATKLMLILLGIEITCGHVAEYP